jgi:integrase/recombinase XerD
MTKKGTQMQLDKAIEEFLFHSVYEKNLSEKSIKAYKIDLGQFLEYKELSDTSIEDIDKSLIREYIKYLYEQELKPKSIKRKIAVLKTLFNFLEYEEYIEVTPFYKMNISIKEPTALPKTIQLKDIRKLLKYVYRLKKEFVDKSSYTYKAIIRDIVIIELLFSTGMRVAEICNLKPNDITNLNDVRIKGKGDKERYIYLFSTEVKDAFREYLSLFGDKIASSEWLFINRLNSRVSEQSVRNMIKKYQKEANIAKDLTPHMFRHSFATMLLEEGVDIRYIQHILGHSSISTTQIYTQVNQKASKKILSSKHPRNSLNLNI